MKKPALGLVFYFYEKYLIAKISKVKLKTIKKATFLNEMQPF
jgi:hypothetical protein